jgi:hypothetical protein
VILPRAFPRDTVVRTMRTEAPTEALVADRLPAVTDLRHRLHRIPELCFEEFKTAAAVRAELDRLGIAYVAGVEGAPTATIAVIGDHDQNVHRAAGGYRCVADRRADRLCVLLDARWADARVRA